MPTAHRPLRIAHRGMPRRARENTLASFALAIEAGADGIELDVHETADGVVVVHHDPDVPGGFMIAALTFEGLRRLPVTADAEIPTLGEVCSLVRGRAEIFVEVKGSGIERAVVASLGSYDGAFALHSFDHALVRRLAAMHTGYRLGILLEEPSFEESSDVERVMAETGALDIWPHFPLVTADLVSRAQAQGCRVIPWTVNTPSDAIRLAGLGVDGICTDDVGILRDVG